MQVCGTLCFQLLAPGIGGAPAPTSSLNCLWQILRQQPQPGPLSPGLSPEVAFPVSGPALSKGVGGEADSDSHPTLRCPPVASVGKSSASLY